MSAERLTMDTQHDDMEKLLADAQTRLIEAVREARGVPVRDNEHGVMHYALEALTSVVPQLPSMIDAAVQKAMGTANARIFSRVQMRRFLVQILVDTLVQQTYAITRWMRVRRRKVAR